jgi:hypothetical protein
VEPEAEAEPAVPAIAGTAMMTVIAADATTRNKLRTTGMVLPFAPGTCCRYARWPYR